jgi:autotransporter-associated beta strand protein
MTALTGNFVQTGDAIWNFDLDAGLTADGLAISGAASLGNWVNSINLNGIGATITPGTYPLITAASGLTGMFQLGSITGNDLPAGFTYALVNSPTQEQPTFSASIGAFYWRGTTGSVWNAVPLAGQTNWASDAAGTNTIFGTPGAASDVCFSTSNAPAIPRTTTLEADFAIKSLTINEPSNLTIDSGAGGPHTLTFSGDAGTGINAPAGVGLVTIAANLALAGGSDTITANNTAGVTISGPISGNNGLIKNGSGPLVMTGANTYTGITQINAGYIQIGNDVSGNLSGTSSVILADSTQLFTALADGATFTPDVSLAGFYSHFLAQPSGTNTFSGTVSGPGHFELLTGTVILTGANTYSGQTGVGHGGTLQVGDGVSGNILAGGLVILRDDCTFIANLADHAAFAPGVFLIGPNSRFVAAAAGTNTISGGI